MQRLIFIFSLFILAIVGCSSNESHSFLIRPDGGGEDAATEIEVGKTIPAWQEGVMDIHFINTTTGESMFVIFPDGTQMLIDAASSSVTTNSNSNSCISIVCGSADSSKKIRAGYTYYVRRR